MGQAKQRGSFEQRNAKAQAEGRIKIEGKKSFSRIMNEMSRPDFSDEGLQAVTMVAMTMIANRSKKKRD